MGEERMKFTRRKLAGVIAAAPVVAGALVTARAEAQSPETETEETKSAREVLRNNLEQIAKVKLARAVEPAFKFKA
jgi:hypothetical protein